MSLRTNYTILEELGQGSMATVTRAVQRSLERVVAIKRIAPHLARQPEFVARFEREAKASAHLKNVNVLDIIDFGRDSDGTPYIVMEFIDGPTLLKVLSGQKLPLPVVLSVAIQMLNGLDHAHSNGVVHRDIKPANVMVTSQGVVKITDFGIAQAAQLPSMTIEGTRIGTPYYMSPEQAEGRRLDHRSDLFSMGTVLYEMLAHQLPFQGDSAVVMAKVVREAPPPLRTIDSTIPPPIIAAVDRAMQKDVTRRFFDAAEFSFQLESAAMSLGIRTGPRIVKEYLEKTHGVRTADGLSSSVMSKLRPTHDSYGARPTVALLPLQGCMGCHVNLLDLHERLDELNHLVDIRFTHLMDVKTIPQVDIGIVEGCVANTENEERLKRLREKCTTLVALGTCACFGGVPGLRNLVGAEEAIDRAYRPAGANIGPLPDAAFVPALQPLVRTVASVVKTDLSLPGCPAPPDLVVASLKAFLKTGAVPPANHNLCHQCGRKRVQMLSGQRKFISDDVVPLMCLPEIDPELCFLEQGVPCMGLATREGCGARCTSHNVPCQGCMGPPPNSPESGTKWIDAMGSLLPGGVLRFKHDLTGLAYRYTLPVSMMPGRKDK